MKHVVAFAAGLLFAVGLGLAGMTQPAKVIGFLDILGDWDPSLAFVMVGAIGVHFVLFRLILKRPTPYFASSFQIPGARHLDRRLLFGAVIFGTGWAIGGYCPGPAIVSFGAGSGQAWLFMGAMISGMLLFHWMEHTGEKRRGPVVTDPAAKPEESTVAQGTQVAQPQIDG